jgi:hypothetical protein
LIDLVVVGIVVGMILLLIGVSVIVLIIILRRKRRTVYSEKLPFQKNGNDSVTSMFITKPSGTI